MSTPKDTKRPGTEVEPSVAQAIEGINKGSVDYRKLLSIVAHASVPEVIPSKLPAPAVVTDDQRKALKRLLTVFGQVVPTERRALDSKELATLMDEVITLDTVADLAKKRKESIKTTVFNHFDVLYENKVHAEHPDADEAKHILEETQRNADGHYVLADEAPAPGQPKKFQRSVREGTITLDPVALAALADDETVTDITHQDWIDMTEQVRVLREELVMAKLRKKPALVAVIAKVTTRGNKVAAFLQGKA